MIIARLAAALSVSFIVAGQAAALSTRNARIVEQAACTGDCNGDSAVGVDELLIGVNIALETRVIADCSAFDTNGDLAVTVDELLAAVRNALSGCVPIPTATAPPTPTAKPAPSFTATGPPGSTPTASPSPNATVSPAPTRTPEPPATLTPLPLCAGFTGGALVSFDVCDESLTVWTTADAFIEEARRLLAAGDQRVPVFGSLRDGTGCDPQWSWHPDPAAMSFVDFTIELCDGCPSHVEANKAYWFGTVGQYCPWTARVTDVDDRR